MIKKILLLDDDEDDQLIFRNALSDAVGDSNLVVFSNGLQGLDYLRNIPDSHMLPEVIFLDLNMPLMNGFEFLTIVKKDPALKQIPVVIFSTSENPADKQKASALGAVKFLTKSPEFAVLISELSDIYMSLDTANQE